MVPPESERSVDNGQRRGIAPRSRRGYSGRPARGLAGIRADCADGCEECAIRPSGDSVPCGWDGEQATGCELPRVFAAGCQHSSGGSDHPAAPPAARANRNTMFDRCATNRLRPGADLQADPFQRQSAVVEVGCFMTAGRVESSAAGRSLPPRQDAP